MIDPVKEKELLKLAKAKYQSYKDITLLAEECGLKAGVVYLTLKHHSFIQHANPLTGEVMDNYFTPFYYLQKDG